MDSMIAFFWNQDVPKSVYENWTLNSVLPIDLTMKAWLWTQEEKKVKVPAEVPASSEEWPLWTVCCTTQAKGLVDVYTCRFDIIEIAIVW